MTKFARRSSQLMALMSAVILVGCDRPGATPDDRAKATSSQAAQPASTTPEAAETVVARAVTEAALAHKIVLIEFGASWCKWCANFQTFVHSKDAGGIIADNYVVTNLVVLEEDEKQALENPGAEQLMQDWAGGRKPGLPFYVFLDADGYKIADSMAMPDGGNIGFPYTPEEIGVFMGLLEKTAPRLDSTRRAVILANLRSTGEPVSN